MAFDLSEIGTVAQQIAADPNLQAQFWSDSIKADTRDKDPLKDFTGAEDSGLPFVEATRASVKNGGQKVHFNTRGSVLGQGVKGSTELKSKTARLTYGAFSLTVDMRRFAISEEQLVKYFTNTGANEGDREELIYGLCRDWWSRTHSDDKQIVLRNKALFAANQPNVVRIGNGSTVTDITPADTIDTGAIEDSANTLIGLGAMPMSLDTDEAGGDVPQFLLYSDREVLDPLKDEQRYREGILAASNGKGADAMFFSGKYPKWDNSLIFKHNKVQETGPVRQGSPLLPFAITGAAIADATPTTLTGGGSYNADASLTDTTLYDFYAYFPGYAWSTFSSEVLPTDNNTYYAIIYNTSGADKGKYEIVSYVAAGNNGNRLTIVRELDEVGYTQKTLLTAAGRYTNAHPSKSLVIPCNRWGVPIGYALHMGGNALIIGKGGVEAQKIVHGDDFRPVGTEDWHVKGTGIQTIIGYAPYENTDGNYPNYTLLEGAVAYPRLRLVNLRA